MSFGQQKKSLIACALSFGTDYVLLDEPTNGLDIPSKTQFRSILSKRAEENATIIISTHQVKDVENLIDPIVILSHNAVLLDASVTYAASRNISLWARGENLLAQKYEINYGYPMPRATFMGGVSVNF